jgi:outer membrane protein assembly factor BamB
VIVPQSDGWVRAFDPETGARLWEFDINPKTSVYSLGPRVDRNSLLANAVVYEDRVYIASGRDVEHEEGPGRLVCIDPTKRGDVSSELAADANGRTLPRRRLQAVNAQAGEKSVTNPKSAIVWEFVSSGKEYVDKMHSSMSSVAIANGLVIATDYSGVVHCFDAKSGQRYGSYDTQSAILASPLIVGDNVYVADEDGDVIVFRLGRDPKYAEPIATVAHGEPIYSSPAYANGVLYVATRDRLYAIDAAEARHWHDNSGNWPQWRGPNRDNRSRDTGLLAKWPPDGPPVAWRVEGLGDGIASLAITDGRVFTTTTYGGSEYAMALDEETGERLWAIRIDSVVAVETPLMRWLSQRTPTVDTNRVFVFTSSGWLVCLEATSGAEIWRVSYPYEFGTPRGKWGFCDRPLVDGNTLVCTPGGSKATLAGLDKRTGKVVWSKLLESREPFAYAAPMLVDTNGLKQYVVFLDKGLVSFAADDRRVLWRYDGVSSNLANTYTPLILADGLLCPNGYRTGLARLKLSRRENDVSVQEVYSRRELLDPFEDSPVLVDGRLLAFRQGTGATVMSFDVADGKRLWEPVRGSGTGKAASTYADGHIYIRWEDGTVGLVEVNTDRYAETSHFKLPDARRSLGSTFPVVSGGRLYVRDNDRLYCFDVLQHERGAAPQTTNVVQMTPLKDDGAKPRPPGERVPNAIFVPTPQDVVDKMLAAAKVSKDDVVYDLGSGDGRIVIAAAKKYGCRAVGLEIDRDLVKLSQERVKEAKLEKLVSIKDADLFDTDFSDATVIAVYLPSNLLQHLLPKFAQLKPGVRIVSHQFEIPDQAPEKTIAIESNETGAKHSIYLWTTPLKK